MRNASDRHRSATGVATSMNGFEVLRHALERDTGVAAGTAALHASVCVLVAQPDPTPAICLVRRAQWADDPWSGHIALPGGSRAGNETPAETVRREVMEEIGVSIAGSEELTALPALSIRLAGRERTLLLDSFVYRITGPVPALRCGAEIESAFWAPITELWNPANLDCLALGDRGDTLAYPAVRLPEGTVFGITLRVLMLLADRIGTPLPHLEEIPKLRRDVVGIRHAP